jgi:hypothetical protein
MTEQNQTAPLVLNPKTGRLVKPESLERARKRAAAVLAPQEEIEETWLRLSKQLLADAPELYGSLKERHDLVVNVGRELVEIEKGVGIYLWPPALGKNIADTDAVGLDVHNVFPDPCSVYRQIKDDIAANGSIHFREQEGMRDGDAETCRPAGSKSDGSAEDCYRRYGFRLSFEVEQLQKVRAALLIYALDSKDEHLDWDIVNEALADWQADRTSCKPYDDIVKQMIAKYRKSCESLPLSETELVEKTMADLADAGEGALNL